MKSFLFYLNILLTSALFAQQNLVPNPSFENTTSCPEGINEVYKAIGWSSFGDTPNYFNRCTPVTDPISVSVPKNFVGIQEPASGDAYVGFITFAADETREHVGTQLISSLIKGVKYFVSFKVCPAFGGDWNIYSASNKLGVKFSTVKYVGFQNPAPINNFAHVYTNSVIKDTTNWTTISGSFVADSAYNYIMLGNFFDNNNTDTIKFEVTNNDLAYCFYDDICVSTDSAFSANWTAIKKTNKINSFKVFPNPSSEKFLIETSIAPDFIKMYDFSGKLILSETQNLSVFTEVNLSEINSGLYSIVISIAGKELKEKIIVTRP